ncbi:MAG TPA: hypothetical protein VGR15_00555 [Bacteroidota bacterium]|jgi:cytochrome c oxidase subunit 2|nr:hypothetical protein [Bacteroidota bacterium]
MEEFLNLPPDGSQHGPALDGLIGIVHWLMFALFFGWGIFYIFTLIRFRKSRNPKANYAGVKSHFSNYLEVSVLVIEVILLVGFSIPLWSKRVDAFPAEKDALRIHVVAEQFAWNIHYPGPDGKFGRRDIKLIDTDNPLGLDRTDQDAKDDITTINQLNLPVNKPVIIDLTTKDVIHSFNLPFYRAKHDAIPGTSIPIWFTPVKTTEQIREELRHGFSIAAAMKKVGKVVLPQMTKTSLRKGMDMRDQMIMQDVTDSSGSSLVAKGDHLNAENIERIIGAGMNEVSNRSVANLEKFVLMEEQKTGAGEMIAGKNEALTEDVVTKLAEAGVKEVTARQASYIDPFVVMEQYADKSGTQICAKGDPLTEELITKFAEAGMNEIVLAPATPTEIACAQLCGLGHYRMRGYVTVQTPEEFKAWYDQEESALNPPAGDATSGVPTDSTSTSAVQESQH